MVITAQNINNKPGYKQTEVGVIPEDWVVKKLGEVFHFLTTTNNPRSDLSENGEIEYIHYGDIHTKWRTFLDCSSDALPLIQRNKVRNVPFLEDGDLVMADASEDYEGLGISVEVKNATGRKVVAGLHTFLLRGNKEVLVDGFKGYLQYIPCVKDSLKKAATGISVYGISKNNAKNILIYLPTYTEQQAIATALSNVDALITSLDKLITKKRAIKQATMQQLLTGTMRLLGFGKEVMPGYKQTEVGLIPDDWEVHSVEEIADVTTGDKNTQDKTESGAYPFFVRSQIVERINSYSYEGEAVLTAGDGVGVGKVFHYANGKFDFHQRVYMIYNFRQFDSFYFYLYFSSNFYKEATKYNAKNSVDSVRREMVTGMKIPHPSLPEQQAIATVLSDMDAEITALEQKRDKIRALKQGMIQELLTGKTRLL